MTGWHRLARVLAGAVAALALFQMPASARRTIVQEPGTCVAAARLAGGMRDAGPALQACFDAAPRGGRVVLPPGRYVIAMPIGIHHPLTLATRGVPASASPCARDERRCATLHLAIRDGIVSSAIQPFTIDSDDVRVDHLVFVGTRLSDPRLSARRCAAVAGKPMAGGIRVTGDRISVSRSTFRDMACYTAFEYVAGADVVIVDNDFVGNGTHDAALRWSDGLTIHDARRFRVAGNRFRDNTDVQLIFGSCIDCRIVGNDFRHGAGAAGGSFAELMLQAWPKATSGDFTGTKVSGNVIDCGAMRRCGFGIMIGSAPWYDAPTFGGMVVDNRVSGAMLPLNVDYLTGPMTIKRNRLVATSGRYPSMCGPQRIDRVSANVSPRSRAFVPPMAPDNVTTSVHYCILNYAIAPGRGN